MQDLLQSLITALDQEPAIPYLKIYRMRESEWELPRANSAYLLLILQGQMRLQLANELKSLQAGDIYVAEIKSPQIVEVKESLSAKDFMALQIQFSPEDLIAVMLDIDWEVVQKHWPAKPHFDLALEDILALIQRIVSLADHKKSFMVDHLKRELIFELLLSPYGQDFLQASLELQQAGEIYNINHWIKTHYKKTLNVQDLASQHHMSPSNFHQKFKQAVGMGPLQCQKQLRLVEGRRLMLDEDLTVTDAALEVGYESVSEFIRDYRRLFDESPQKNIQKLRRKMEER